ncbi:MAG: FAD-binding oxidoreductase [Chloroflexi bacterium]|nr:FAD-binding oxidoreductase [Chloroflexota bacterium]
MLANIERLRAWDYPCTAIDRAEAATLAPDVTLPPAGTADYAFAPDEGWVEVGPLVGRLLAAAMATGATVRWPAPVERLLVDGGRVTGVMVAGEHHAAGWVIDCAGCAAGALLVDHGPRPRQRASAGLLIVTEAAAIDLTPIVHAPGLHLRPDGNGRLLIGSDEVDATLVGLPPDAPAPGAFSAPTRDLLLRARAIVPALAGVEIESTRLCWRPMPADGLSAVGPIAHLPGYYLALTHSGVTLAPVLADLIATEIISERPAPALEPFRPGRLQTDA